MFVDCPTHISEMNWNFNPLPPALDLAELEWIPQHVDQWSSTHCFTSEVCPDSSFAFVPVALQSVFPQTELGAFMVLLKKDKEQQLKELTMIVIGIRLFNKASKKAEEETDPRELSTVHQSTDITCSVFLVMKSFFYVG